MAEIVTDGCLRFNEKLDKASKEILEYALLKYVEKPAHVFKRWGGVIDLRTTLARDVNALGKYATDVIDLVDKVNTLLDIS